MNDMHEFLGEDFHEFQNRCRERIARKFPGLSPADVLQESHRRVLMEDRWFVEGEVADPEIAKRNFYRALNFECIDLYRRRLALIRNDANLVKKRLTALASQLPDRLTSPSESFNQKELEQVLQAMLEHLDDISKDIVMLKFYDGMAAKEIAEVVDITENNVNVKVFRALRELKRLILEKTDLNAG